MIEGFDVLVPAQSERLDLVLGRIAAALDADPAAAGRLHDPLDALDATAAERCHLLRGGGMLHLVRAIVTDHGSYASHAGIVSREMGIPAVVGTVDGSRRIPDGARVRVDGTAGEVTVLM